MSARNGVFPDYARRYGELGWSLIRLDGKVPKGRDWQQQRPVRDLEHLAGLWSTWGERWNMGVVLGQSNVAVVEFDTEEAGRTLLELLGGKPPLTPTVKTGSGRLHFYFRPPDGVEKAARDGIELRVGAHQCVAPPSTHPDTGRPYEWISGREPWSVELAEVPQAVLDYVAETHRNGSASPVPDLIPIGEIDRTLTSLAGSMRRRNASENEICAALVEMLKRCEPGHTHTEADCRRIARSVGRYIVEQRPPRIDGSEEHTVSWRRLSEVEMRSIRFRDKPLLQADAFHLLTGRKGQGKGTVLSGIAARVNRGELGEKSNVVWIGSEDSNAIDVKPRIVAAGGEPERVLVVKEGWIQLPRDVDEIRWAMEEMGEVGMLVIDPVGNHITGKDSNSDTDIRDAIGPLNKLADEFECMVFGVRHLSEKECSRGVLAAILGASAWVHVPRAVLAVARDDEDPQVTHVQCVAGNRLPPDTPGRMFRIEGAMLEGLENEVTKAVWIGDSSKDVETMLTARTDKRPPSKSTVARELILDTLEEAKDRQMESDELDALIAAETGLAAQTIRNIRVGLKDEGLIRAVPEKDEYGSVERWLIVRTLAERREGSVSGNPDTDFPERESVSGGAKPETEPVTLETEKTVSGNPDTEFRVYGDLAVSGEPDEPF